MTTIPRNAFKVYISGAGMKRLDFIQRDGRVYQLIPTPEIKKLSPGYYTTGLKLIRPLEEAK